MNKHSFTHPYLYRCLLNTAATNGKNGRENPRDISRLLCDSHMHLMNPKTSHPRDQDTDYVTIRYAHTLIHRIVVYYKSIKREL